MQRDMYGLAVLEKKMGYHSRQVLVSQSVYIEMLRFQIVGELDIKNESVLKYRPSRLSRSRLGKGLGLDPCYGSRCREYHTHNHISCTQSPGRQGRVIISSIKHDENVVKEIISQLI